MSNACYIAFMMFLLKFTGWVVLAFVMLLCFLATLGSAGWWVFALVAIAFCLPTAKQKPE